MSKILPLGTELLVLIVVGTIAAAATWFLMSRLSKRVFAGRGVAVIAYAAAVSVVITEVWAQFSTVPRYDRITLLISIASAVLAVIMQSKNKQSQ